MRRIFRDYAAGIGPRGIARTLNDEGIPGPHGRLWNDTTIQGHVKRGTGIVNNELYIGRLAWAPTWRLRRVQHLAQIDFGLLSRSIATIRPSVCRVQMVA